ncbi:MAG TPA: hypothetical protein PK599_05480 [bacterium]|nr:hypothetical protein [bacterium]
MNGLISGRGDSISIGDAVAYLAVLILSLSLVVYLIIDPIAYKANFSYASGVKNVRKEAYQKGQYVVFETDKQNPYEVFAFIFLFAFFSSLIILIFLGGLATNTIDATLVPAAEFLIAMWVIFTGLYVLYMLTWMNQLVFVTNAGIELRLLDAKGRTTNQFIRWSNIAQIQIYETDKGRDRFAIHIMNGDHKPLVKIYGDWINAKLFCRDALKNVHSSRFTLLAMNYFSKYAAKETDLPEPPVD